MASKKEWFKIVTPLFLGEKVIGETTTDEPKKLIGRIVNANARDVAEKANMQINITLMVNEVEGKKAKTIIKEYELSRQYLSRINRRKIAKIGVVQDLKTSDGVSIRIKGFAVTNKKVSRDTRTKIRKMLEEELKKKIEASAFETIIQTFLGNTEQREISRKLSKIYPTNSVEIRKIVNKDAKIKS